MAGSTRRLSPPCILVPLEIGLVTYIVMLIYGGKLLGDPDVYLHVAVGRWIIAHGFVPHEDVFSFSMHGAPWVLHEWLSEVLFAALYDRLAWIGLIVLTAVSFAIALAVLTNALLKFLQPRHALVGVATAWILCIPSLLARPNSLIFPLLVGWVAALVSARSENRAPSPFYVVLITLWANLHGSFIFGLVLAAMFGGEALLESRDRRAVQRTIMQWGFFGVLSLAAAAITPNGVGGLLLPVDLARMSFALSWINEWRSPDFQSFPPIEMWLLLLLAGGLLAGLRFPITRVAMLLVLVHMTLHHRRHGAFLGLITPLLFAPALASQLRLKFEEVGDGFFGRASVRKAMPATTVIAVVATFLLAIGATVWSRGLKHDEDSFTPSAALTAVRQNAVKGRVFNDYNFGGFLIFSGVPTFIDGRADMYGDDFMRRYAQPDQLPGLLDQYKIDWTILAADHVSVPLLDHLPGWHRIYSDNIAIVHVREKSLSP